MFRTLCVVVAAICLWHLPQEAAAQQQGAWRVLTLNGVVRVRVGSASHAALANEVLRPGAVVSTGADSSASIGNGLQRMTMSANSRMTIADDAPSGMTRIIETLGSILFQVDHREAPHFVVETSRLAAIVKGTSFSVIVRERADVVAVANGLVEVRTREGDSSVDVPTGHAARVTALDRRHVVLFDNPAEALSEAPNSAAAALEIRAGSVRTEATQAPAGLSAPAPNFAVGPTRDRDGLVNVLAAYFGVCFVLGLGAYFAFRLFEGARQRRDPRRDARRS